MSSFLVYILKSTLSISLLYLFFRMVMRKETFFALNRLLLLTIVASSTIIPLVYLPQTILPVIQTKLTPVIHENEISPMGVSASEETSTFSVSSPYVEIEKPVAFSIIQLISYVYLAGVLISFLMLIYGIVLIMRLFGKARKTDQHGIHLMIVDKDLPAFSFGRYILISQHDFETNSEAIITHELSHIRMGHFYDLVLMELAKIIFWFNPLIYRMVSDLKEIHEFQADDHTLTTGIDATQYQLLIIQKSVGPQRFALANSFNHCQIKNRITMMNKQKTSKAGLWKVATFLPLLALLLMAFGKTGEIVPFKIASSASETPSIANESPSIVGTWRLVSYNYGGGDEMKSAENGIVRIKLITETNFSWNHYLGTGKTVINSAGGSYVLSGEDYTETIEYGSSGMANYIGKVQKFKVKIEKDQIELSGELSDGLKIKEIWEKYQPSDKASTIAPPPPPPIFKIEMRKDGNYIDNKLSSLEEIRKKAEEYRKSNANAVVSINEGNGVPLERVNEIKEVLRNAKIQNIKYNTTTTTTFSKPLPPPPPPTVYDPLFEIDLRGQEMKIQNKSYSMEELEKKLKEADVNKKFVRILTSENTNDELDKKLKGMLEKNQVSYQINRFYK